MKQAIAFNVVLIAGGCRMLWVYGIHGSALVATVVALIMYALLATTVARMLRLPERQFLKPFWNCVSFIVFTFLMAIWYTASTVPVTKVSTSNR